jgi:hypothetical protein
MNIYLHAGTHTHDHLHALTKPHQGKTKSWSNTTFIKLKKSFDRGKIVLAEKHKETELRNIKQWEDQHEGSDQCRKHIGSWQMFKVWGYMLYCQEKSRLAFNTRMQPHAFSYNPLPRLSTAYCYRRGCESRNAITKTRTRALFLSPKLHTLSLPT